MPIARFQLGPLRMSAYMAAALIGLIVGLIVTRAMTTRLDHDPHSWLIALIACGGSYLVASVISRIARGRAVMVASEMFLAALVATALVAHLADAPTGEALDLAAIGISVLLSVGRIGCSHAGCCHGRPRRRGLIYGDSHVAMGFPRALAGVALSPIQLAEAAAHAVIVWIAVVVSSRAEPGMAAATVAALYSIVRIVCEARRGDAERRHWAGVSETQWLALATLAVVVVATRGELAAIAAAAAGVLALLLDRWRAGASARDLVDTLTAMHDLPDPTETVATASAGAVVVSRSRDSDGLRYGLSRDGAPFTPRAAAELADAIALVTDGGGDIEITAGERVTHLLLGDASGARPDEPRSRQPARPG